MAGEPKQTSKVLSNLPNPILSAKTNEYINLNHVRFVTGSTDAVVSLLFYDASEQTTSYLLEDKIITANSYLDIYSLALEPGDEIKGSSNAADCHATVHYESSLPLLGGTSGVGWQPIHSATLTSAADYTVTDLNGDADVVYQIVLEGQLTSGNNEVFVSVKPNNTSDTIFYQFHWARGDNFHDNKSGSLSGGFAIAANSWNADHAIYVNAYLYAKSGKPRKMHSYFGNYETGLPYPGEDWAGTIGSKWSNTIDKITSLTFDFGAATSFSGNVYIFAVGGTSGKKSINALELQERPSDPVPSNYGLQLYAKDNRLLQQSSDGKILTIACEDSFEITGGNVGTFVAATAQKKTIAGVIGANSAIKIDLPNNTSTFVSTWAIVFRDSTQGFDLSMRLSGVYNAANFTPFSNPWLSWNWNGRYPSGFGIYWYIGARYGNNLNLANSTANSLNLGIYQSGATRELHIYNRASVAAHFVADFTYSTDI